MVCPHLEYWVQLWSSPPQNRVELEKVQRRATKMIKDTELTYKEQLSKLGLFHLEKETMKGKWDSCKISSSMQRGSRIHHSWFILTQKLWTSNDLEASRTKINRRGFFTIFIIQWSCRTPCYTMFSAKLCMLSSRLYTFMEEKFIKDC